jgi:hypothetical protein
MAAMFSVFIYGDQDLRRDARPVSRREHPASAIVTRAMVTQGGDSMPG